MISSPFDLLAPVFKLTLPLLLWPNEDEVEDADQKDRQKHVTHGCNAAAAMPLVPAGRRVALPEQVTAAKQGAKSRKTPPNIGQGSFDTASRSE